MREQKEIMYDSPEAAKPYTMNGWLSSNGHFYKEESMARYQGCTHQKCECGNKMSKGWSKCDNCRAISSRKRYEEMPIEEWDGKTPLVIYNDDQYFFDEDSIRDYCVDNDCSPEDLQLVICEPNYPMTVSEDYWSDQMPTDDGDGELPKGLQEKLDELNEYISKMEPLSWSQGKRRVIVKLQE